MSGGDITTEQFSLRWNNYHTNLKSGFHNLFTESEMIDVTLAVDGHFLRAHKIILSICSPYFKEMFKMNPCDHPIVILKDIDYENMKDILQFMYMGEVSILSENLSSFLKTAETLQIKGLTGDDSAEDPVSTKDDKSDSDTSDGDDKDEIYDQLIETTTAPMPDVEILQPNVQYQQNSPLPLNISTPTTSLKRSPNSFSFPSSTASSSSANNNDHKKLKYSDCTGNYYEYKKQQKESDKILLSTTSNCSGNPIKSEIKQELKDTNEETAKDYTKNNYDGGSGSGGDGGGVAGSSNGNLWENNSMTTPATSFSTDNYTDQGDDKTSANIKSNRPFLNGKHQCNTCKKIFTRRDHLRTHEKNIHGSDAGPLACGICGQYYKNMESLRKHLSKFHSVNQIKCTNIIDLKSPNSFHCYKNDKIQLR